MNTPIINCAPYSTTRFDHLRTRRAVLVALFAGTALAAAPTLAQQAAVDVATDLADADAVLRCVSANAPESTFSQVVELVTRDASGSGRTQRAKMYGQSGDGDLMLTLQVTDPIDVAGAAVLIRRRQRDAEYFDDQYVYLPSLQRSRRVVGGMAESPMLGTDLSYSDVARFFGAFSDAETQIMDDPNVRPGRVKISVQPVAVLSDGATPAEPVPNDLAKLTIEVERSRCVPLRVEMFDLNDRLTKTIVVDPDSIQRYGNRHMAHRFVVTSVEEQSTTAVDLSRVKLDPSLSSGLFHQRSYYRAR